MITKTIRGETMMEVLETVKKDLGSEALIISVRQIPGGPAWQVWRKPVVEVVAARLEDGDHQASKQNVENAQPLLQKPAQPAKTPNLGAMNVQAQMPRNKPQMAFESDDDSMIEDEMPELENYYPFGRRANSLPVAENPAPKEATKQKPEGFAPYTPPRIVNEPKPVMVPVQNLVQVAPLPVQTPSPNQPAVMEPAAKPDNQEAELPPVLDQMIQALRFQGVEGSILKRVSKVCMETLSPRVMQDERRVRECLHKQLEASIHIQKESSAALPKIIFLVGSSGAGKTSTCAKLAVHYTKNFHQKVVWVCADTVRIGAIAEARTYTDTIGIPLRLAYTPEDLVTEIEQASGSADIILVDTPAFNPRKEESIVDLGALLTAVPKRTTWMVIPSTAKEIDLQNAISSLGPFRPKAVILSKLDETNSFSSVFNLAARTQLPFAYFTFGRRVLNDISVANASQFIKALLDERFVA